MQAHTEPRWKQKILACGSHTKVDRVASLPLLGLLAQQLALLPVAARPVRRLALLAAVAHSIAAGAAPQLDARHTHHVACAACAARHARLRAAITCTSCCATCMWASGGPHLAAVCAARHTTKGSSCCFYCWRGAGNVAAARSACTKERLWVAERKAGEGKGERAGWRRILCGLKGASAAAKALPVRMDHNCTV